jgi:hypothetical protein
VGRSTLMLQEGGACPQLHNAFTSLCKPTSPVL